MEIIFRQLNPHACRTYLIGTQGSTEVVLIDPVLEHVQDYLALLDQEQLKLTHVIDTHTHADHLSGGAALKDQTDCEYVMHTKAPAHCVSFRISDGFECHLGEIPVKIMHTPGYTKDSVTLIFPDRLLASVLLLLFACLMLVVGGIMLRGRRATDGTGACRPLRCLMIGAAVGVLIGFLVIALIGVGLGLALAGRIPEHTLRKLFAGFVPAVACVLLITNVANVAALMGL
jgi:Metallo-beta-lactamase superfamily